jgi:hypothetical protein
MGRPWADAGFQVITIDILPPSYPPHPNYDHIQADVRDLKPIPAYALFAFPPCTHLARVGNRWWARKGPAALTEALSIVNACQALAIAADTDCWFLENPPGRLARNFRPHDHFFHPADYGDPYSKQTLLWTGPDFVMPDKHPVPVTSTLDKYTHALYGCRHSKGHMRSKTPKGFAEAVFRANAPVRFLQGFP